MFSDVIRMVGFSASLSTILIGFFLSKTLEGLETETLLFVFDIEIASEMYSRFWEF